MRLPMPVERPAKSVRAKAKRTCLSIYDPNMILKIVSIDFNEEIPSFAKKRRKKKVLERGPLIIGLDHLHLHLLRHQCRPLR